MAKALACMEHSEKRKRINAELMQGMMKGFPDMTAVGMKGRGGATSVKPHSVLTKSPNGFLDSILSIYC